MKFVKARKPRGIKKNGQRSKDLCPHCFAFHCDPVPSEIGNSSETIRIKKMSATPTS
jgi:hypothetical protein